MIGSSDNHEDTLGSEKQNDDCCTHYFCCSCLLEAIVSLPHQNDNIRGWRFRILKGMHSPVVEGIMLILLVSDICGSIFELFLKIQLLESKQVYTERFCGLEPSEGYYCLGTRFVYNSTGSASLLDDISEADSEIKLLYQIMNGVYYWTMCVLVAFVIENSVIFCVMGWHVLEHPMTMLDGLISYATFGALVAKTGPHLLECTISEYQDAHAFYQNGADDGVDGSWEGFSSQTQSACMTETIEGPSTCGESASVSFQVALNFLIIFRSWRVLRLIHGVLKANEKRHLQLIADNHANDMAKLSLARKKHAARFIEGLNRGTINWALPISVRRNVKAQLLSPQRCGSTLGQTFAGDLVMPSVTGIGSNNPLAVVFKRVTAPKQKLKNLVHVSVKEKFKMSIGRVSKLQLAQSAQLGSGKKVASRVVIDRAAVIALQELSRHKRLALLYGIYQNACEPKSVYFVSESIEGCGRMNGREQMTSLGCFLGPHAGLQQSARIHMSWRQQLQCTLDILEGLDWLHGHGVCHGNLCPSNVLFCAPLRGTPDLSHAFLENSDKSGVMSVPQLEKFLDELEVTVDREALMERSRLCFGEREQTTYDFGEAQHLYADLTESNKLFRVKLSDPWMIRACMRTEVKKTHSLAHAFGRTKDTHDEEMGSAWLARYLYKDQKDVMKSLARPRHSSDELPEDAPAAPPPPRRRRRKSNWKGAKALLAIAHGRLSGISRRHSPSLDPTNVSHKPHRAWQDSRTIRDRSSRRWLHRAGVKGALATIKAAHVKRVQRARFRFGWVPPEFMDTNSSPQLCPSSKLTKAGDIFVLGAMMRALTKKFSSNQHRTTYGGTRRQTLAVSNSTSNESSRSNSVLNEQRSDATLTAASKEPESPVAAKHQHIGIGLPKGLPKPTRPRPEGLQKPNHPPPMLNISVTCPPPPGLKKCDPPGLKKCDLDPPPKERLSFQMTRRHRRGSMRQKFGRNSVLTAFEKKNLPPKSHVTFEKLMVRCVRKIPRNRPTTVFLRRRISALVQMRGTLSMKKIAVPSVLLNQKYMRRQSAGGPVRLRRQSTG